MKQLVSGQSAVALDEFHPIEEASPDARDWGFTLYPERGDMVVIHCDYRDYTGLVTKVYEATGRVTVDLLDYADSVQTHTFDLERVDVLVTHEEMDEEAAAAFSALAEITAA